MKPCAGNRYHAYLATSRFGSLDGLRFVAIAAVLFHHSPYRGQLLDAHAIFGRGFLGVDLFFVISGFLITTLLLRERRRTGHISLRGFYKRRALRILPLYLLVVTGIGAYYVFAKRLDGAAELWPYYYLFLANFLVADIPLLSPMWSLAVEEQYYLLWPLLLVLFVPRILPFVLAALVAFNIALLFGAFGQWSVEMGALTITENSFVYVAILMGSALAIALDNERGFAFLRLLLGERMSALVWALALTVMLFVLPPRLSDAHDLIIHITMTMLVGSLVIREDSAANGLLRLRPIIRIGVISYGIYMLHLVALDIAVRISSIFGFSKEGLLCNVIYVALAIAMAEVSFRYFEKVFLDLRHKDRGVPAATLKP